MNAQRWQQLNDLFHSALERAPDERIAFLDGSPGYLQGCP